jgi:antitoxin component YwqK of YwqJK toxin-antitoxin module
MMPLKVLIASVFFITSTHTALGQYQQIFLLHDTLLIGFDDTIFYKTGDESNGVIEYCNNGNLTQISIKDGFITRLRQQFSNPQITEEENYKNGMLDGPYKEWNNDGVLVTNGHYTMGLKDSIWTFYYENGGKETEGTFFPDSTGLIDRFCIIQRIKMYPPEKSTSISAPYQDHSPPHGPWNFYDKKGKIYKTLVFDKGVLISIEVGDHYEDE